MKLAAPCALVFVMSFSAFPAAPASLAGQYDGGQMEGGVLVLKRFGLTLKFRRKG